MKYLIHASCVLCICLGLSSRAQDVHLSQFYTAQLNLNPALGGYYNGDFRMAANYRNQWREINKPITTMMFAFDKKIPFHSDEINAGILLVQDQFAGFSLNTHKVLLSGAYRKQMGYNLLSGGVQFGYTFKSTDLDGQTFPNQWVYENGTFDPNVSNLENGLQVEQNYMDVNAGIALTRIYSNITPTVGLSLFHVNRPEDRYSDEATEKRTIRKVLHADAVVELNNDLDLQPKVLYMWTTKAQDMMLGSLLEKKVTHHAIRSVNGGLLYRGGIGRNSDAVIPTIGLATDKFNFGLSYDITVSALSATDPRSTLELSIIYTAPVFSPASLTIPCDRF